MPPSADIIAEDALIPREVTESPRHDEICRCHRRGANSGNRRQSSREKINEALVPPNPKELLNTVRMSCSRLTWGT